MKYMLDTDICIYVINNRPQHVLDRFREHRVGDIGISSIALSELRYGAENSRNSEQNLTALIAFVTPLEILADGETEAETYGRIRAELEAQGEPIGSMDLLIAAHALNLGVTLITNNVREFSKVKDLRVESWA